MAAAQVDMWANRNVISTFWTEPTESFSWQTLRQGDWMSGFDVNGRPIQTRQPEGQPPFPESGRNELVLPVL